MVIATHRDAPARISGEYVEPSDWYELIDPYRTDVIGRAARSEAALVDAAVSSAKAAQLEVAAMPSYRRAALLREVARLVEERAGEIAHMASRQMGKSLKNTTREVSRSSWTFRSAATAAETLDGSVLNPSAAPDSEGIVSLVVREPVGVVGAITPFNSSFNLVAHKVAPALAAGNSVVVKPASPAPMGALDLAALVEEAGFPAGSVNVIPGDRSTAANLIAHSDVDLLSFTGGRAGGEAVRRGAGLRRVLLELGGNSPNIIHYDANVEAAARECARGGFANTGQSCNSVQRVIVHERVLPQVTEVLVSEARKLKVGDPLDPSVDVGTLVNEESALRISEWLEEAVSSGARVLTGGERSGATLTPTVVVDVPRDARLACEEIFGPVVVVIPYRDLDEALEISNSTPFGLHSALFTRDLDVVMRVTRGLQFGGVMVNRSSNFRIDHLPFGGIKESGIGREGPPFAILEMTELKHILLAPSDS